MGLTKRVLKEPTIGFGLWLDDLQEVKKVVSKWKADDFTGSDGFAWDCMKEVADIVDETESEDK